MPYLRNPKKLSRKKYPLKSCRRSFFAKENGGLEIKGFKLSFFLIADTAKCHLNALSYPIVV